MLFLYFVFYCQRYSSPLTVWMDVPLMQSSHSHAPYMLTPSLLLFSKHEHPNKTNMFPLAVFAVNNAVIY